MARTRAYVLGAALIVAFFSAAGLFFVTTDDFPREGPLARTNPALERALSGTISLPDVLNSCFPSRAPDAVTKIVGGLVRGKPYYACYGLSGNTDGSVDPVIVDGNGGDVSDADLIKEGGAWPWVGVVTSWRGVLAFSLFAILVLALFGLLYYALEKPKALAGGKSGWRTAWILIAAIGLVIASLVAFAEAISVLLYPDAVGLTAVALMLAALVYGMLAWDIVRAGALVSWLRLRPTRIGLVVALIVSASLFPSVLVGSVFLSALGEVPVTDTLLIGLVVVAFGAAALAALLVVIRWRAERAPTPSVTRAAWRRSFALAVAIALWSTILAVTISVAAG